MNRTQLPKNKRLKIASMLCIVVYFSVFSIEAFASILVKDDRGVELRLNAPAQRVISMLPSLTESVCALGKCSVLVGVDRFSNWPKALDRLPRLGGIADANLEGIVRLKPDLVLLEKSSPIILRLQALGIPVMAFDVQSIADVQRSLRKLDTVLGSTESGAVWDRIQLDIARASRNLTPSQKGIQVYFEVNPAPFAAGKTSFIGELLERLGVQNIVTEKMGAFPKINPEFVVQSKPALIMTSESSAAQLAQRPGWKSIPAIKDGRVCLFNASDADVLVRPGPRVGEAASIIGQCIARTIPK
ncbi:MAG: helical backbone metal receptor [Polynucleobacter sp.]|nr:helical backbone metal receptor [Polynucleobacter sp.]MDZ4057260.1 helical backbone metal receptor [Polynucleobacter sp.]